MFLLLDTIYLVFFFFENNFKLCVTDTLYLLSGLYLTVLLP